MSCFTYKRSVYGGMFAVTEIRWGRILTVAIGGLLLLWWCIR